MRKITTGFAFAAALALCGGSAFAVDQFLVGKKLLITNPPSGTTKNKFLYLSKDTTIALPSALGDDPRCFNGDTAALVVHSPDLGKGFSIPLPCAGWTINGASTLYKYTDPTGATCKIVIIKGGKLLKALCKGSQVDFDLTGPTPGAIDVKIRTGVTPRQWCTTFTATINGDCTVRFDGSKKYLAKNCNNAPTTCVASPSGAFLDGAGLF